MGPVMAAAGGAGVTSMLLLWRRVTRGHLKTFEGWFRYVQPDRTLIARWDDILEVFSASTRRRRLLGRHEYVIVLGGDTSLRFGSEIGADASLGDEIERRTRSTIAARAEAHIPSGIEVGFGPITVSTDSLEVHTLGTRSIPYARARDHRLAGRRYLIRSLDHRRTSSIPMPRIPNPAALHDVITHQIEAACTTRKPGA